MSLSRAFTTRRAKGHGDSMDSSSPSSFLPHRSNTTKSSSSINRNKISAPLELVHTTNMLSYNAPDLPRSALRDHSLPPVTTESHVFRSSDNDSDTINTLDSTPPTSPDVAPGERSSSPDPSHLSTLFMAPGKPLAPPAAVSSDAPVIPKRSPSHTKKASYEAISRSQSISRASKGSLQSSSTLHSTTFSRSSSTSTSLSHMSTHSRKLSAPPRPAMPLSPSTPQTPVQALSIQAPVKTPIRDTHPFGQELAQVSELVEEMNVKAQTTEVNRDDARYLASRGLMSFAVTDYVTIVDELASTFFPDTTHIRVAGPLWI